MNHLGGHLGITHVDHGALRWLRDHFSVRSMLDIGCGPGGMRRIAESLGVSWVGVDGDASVLTPSPQHILHDFTRGPLILRVQFDLAWSTEFVEHVEERYILNYMPAFERCRLVLLTGAPPGKSGHHHVNCRTGEYWRGVFASRGFALDEGATAAIRQASTMAREFIRKYGLVFRRVS